jgi:hypothetical protein
VERAVEEVEEEEEEEEETAAEAAEFLRVKKAIVSSSVSVSWPSLSISDVVVSGSFESEGRLSASFVSIGTTVEVSDIEREEGAKEEAEEARDAREGRGDTGIALPREIEAEFTEGLNELLSMGTGAAFSGF